MNIREYIQGKRKGKEAHELERDAMSDPFLMDAIDGFDDIQGNHAEIIEKLEREIDKKTNVSTFTFNRFLIASAAVMALLIGISVVMKLDNDSLEKKIAQSNLTEKKKNISAIVKGNTKPDSVTITTTTKSIIAQNNIIKFESKENSFRKPNYTSVNTININESEIMVTSDNEQPMSLAQNDTQPKIPIATLTSTQITQQKTPISKNNALKGIVLDENNEPLIGASIVQNGTKLGVITDINGKFEIPQGSFSPTNKIAASYIGYQNTEIPISNDSITIIRMHPVYTALNEEVVVIGYGASKRSQIPSKSSLESSLRGKVAGVSVSTSVFGEKEFKIYLEKNRVGIKCSESKINLKISFYLNNNGKPTSLNILKSNCPEIETNLQKLIDECPIWTFKNRTVQIDLEL